MPACASKPSFGTANYSFELQTEIRRPLTHLYSTKALHGDIVITIGAHSTNIWPINRYSKCDHDCLAQMGLLLSLSMYQHTLFERTPPSGRNKNDKQLRQSLTRESRAPPSSYPSGYPIVILLAMREQTGSSTHQPGSVPTV